MIPEVGYYSAMIRGVHQFLRHPPVADPLATLRLQMEQREAHFLDLAQRIVFADPRNPYHEMFRQAGCDFADLSSSVAHLGLERTLEKLSAAGVWLSLDEFKGHAPLVRGGKEIPCPPGSFLNPLVRGLMETRSGGSRSKGTPARQSTGLKLYQMAYADLETRDLELDQTARVQVYPVLPSSVGLNFSLIRARSGDRIDKWFAPPGTLREAGHYRAMTSLLAAFGRALGASIPFPEPLPQNDFSPVARWLAREKQRGRRCSLAGYVSTVLRVASAAVRDNLDIAGTVFLAGGEALTDAKRAGIEAAGCRVYPRYAISEFGRIGCACSRMRSGNVVHLFSDSVAVVARKRLAPFSEVEVNSLLFTNLLPFAAHFLINAEMGDAAVVEPSACDCAYAALGLTTQLRGIYSFSKLTGQGITLLGSDALRVLEVALPARFGGRAGDYQLVETDAAQQTEITLRVSPRVGAVPAAEVRDFFLAEIRRYYGGALAARLWKHSAGLHVALEEPYTTGVGKVLPLHVLGDRPERSHVA